MCSLELEAAQWPSARHGRPEPDAGVAPSGSHWTAGSAVLPTQQCHAAPSPHAPIGVGERTLGVFFGSVGDVGDPPGATHGGRKTLRQPHGGTPLLGLYPTGRRASEIPDLCSGPTGGRSGLVFGSPAPGSAGPLHRLVGPATPSPDSPAGLQYPLPDPALGEGAPLGQPSIGPGGSADCRRLASAL